MPRLSEIIKQFLPLFLSTLDKSGCHLCSLSQIRGELALDHLVLHFLENRVLRALQVLNQHFLALL